MWSSIEEKVWNIMLNYISFNYVGPGAIEFVPHLPKNKHKEKMENDL